MRIILLTILLTMTVALPSLVSASEEGEHTALDTSMDKMNDAYRDLRRSIRDATEEQKPGYLALMEIMIKEAKAGKDMVPEKVAELPEAKQADMITAYKKEMDGLITELEEIFTLIEQNQFDEASTALRGLRTIKSEGHDRFRKED